MSRIITLLLAVLTVALHVGAADLSKHMPSTSLVLTGYNNIDSVKHAIAERGPRDIEGIWKMTGTQTLVVIEPASHPTLSGTGFEALQIVIISSPRKSMRPGTILGYAVPTARPGYYDACIYTTKVRAILQKHRRFTLHLYDDEQHLSMTPVKSRLNFSVRHTLRFLFRAGISIRNNNNDESFDGFIKQYPEPEGKPRHPVYL